MHGEILKRCIIVDGGIRSHDPKNPWSEDDTICQGNSGILVQFDHLLAKVFIIFSFCPAVDATCEVIGGDTCRSAN